MTTTAESAPMSLQDAFRLAMAHHQAGRWEQAEPIYRQIVALVPQHADSWHLLGVLTHQRGKSREAIALIGKAIALNPAAADYYANLGDACRVAKEPEQALAAFDEALQRQPEHLGALNNKAITLNDLRRHDEAIALCQQALALNPAYVNAIITQANGWQHKGEYHRAADLYRQAIARMPGVAELLGSLAECLLLATSYEDARAVFLQALAQLPGRRSLQAGYAQALRHLGRHDEALRYLAELDARAFVEDAALAVARAECLLAAGDAEAGFQELHAAVRHHPGYVSGRTALVEYLRRLAQQGCNPPPDYPVPARTPPVSIIICSITPERFAAISARYASLFADFDHEIIGIHDARSLAEGYNRGAAGSRGEILIFSHDDIEILNDDFALRLFSHCAQFDLIGVAGTQKLIDPAWRKAGFPHLAGMVAHRRPQDDTYRLSVLGAHESTAKGIEALDGLWLAARREVWEAVRFDEATFDGFHLYDMDFSFGAHLAGYRLAVVTDIVLVHHSHGNYGVEWAYYAEKFRGKYAEALAANSLLEAPLDHLPVCDFTHHDEVLRFAGLARCYLPTGNHQQSASDYALWRKRYAILSESALAAQREQASALPQRPLLSVLMPVYNAPPKWLAAAMDSVLAQTYEHWEMCIADDASPDPAVRQVLQDYAARDARIRVVFRSANGHISAASNSALELVQGEWIVLLDHDDALPPDALFRVAETINQYPDAGLIYSDEDKIDEKGVHSPAYFKSGWNYDLFLGQNMVSHLGVYRTSLIREIGGFRLGLEGSQDYDLALRAIEKLQPEQIRHIPHVLYHWRMLEESTANSAAAKPYAYTAARRAISDHLQRIGVAAEVVPSPDFSSFNRVIYQLPAKPPKVSILIPTRNGLKLLERCIASLASTDYPDFEILIIDNGSDDPATLAYLQTQSQKTGIRLLRDDTPFNFSALNNRAAQQASGEVLCLLNDDTEVISADWLREMVSIALQPGVGAVGARLWYADHTLQHGGILLGMGGVAGRAHHRLLRGQFGYYGRAILTQSLTAVTAACLVIRKDRYQAVGGLNEELAVAFNDVDFCLRLIKAGYRNVWTPYAELYHHESQTRGYEDSPEKRERFRREAAYMFDHWQEWLQNDPAYNPNLSLADEGYGLAWPPRHLG